MTAAFELIQANLLRCTPEERQKLKMLITRHPGTKTKTTAISVNEVEADWLLRGTLSELKRRGQKYFVRDYTQIRSLCSDYEMASREIRDQLMEQIERHIEEPSDAQLKTLGSVSARALADYIHTWRKGPPIALTPMLQNVGRTLEALEHSFPDYIESGMIGCLIDSRL